ncbi:N-acetylglucosaminyldiphosphoundecaprenol N-acetyl-beta-D-mannosaminyltransferase [Gammaproteobacteria bacterium]|nr:N-acetylglucosaminyldiphosphoundecaprenol N-acetyl-beta-D-mannosaminyltransferase [Gammaproteobacteria bacterium]
MMAVPSTTPRRRVDIEGVLLDRIDLADTMARVTRSCETRRPLQIVTANLNFITLARRKGFFRQAINDAGLTVVDGRILLWITRWLGEPAPEQITGHDLMRECLALGRERGYRMFLLGGMPGVAAELAKTLESRNPGLRVQGMDGGRFTETGEAEQNSMILTRIREFDPHFLFVALGAPKQDVWISRNLAAASPAVAVGVGGVFDTLVGRLPRAPRWMQLAGLESLYQLIIEPRRYGRRYLLDDPPTLARIVGGIAMRHLRRLGSPRHDRGADPNGH